ncbi:MAG: hypothetical protein JWO78_802 [Micavibrio sp.]|nr:hypothetical protein [Micavibrio sp.]
MKDFNRVAIMSEQDTVSKGFMFEYIQENFPYNGWQPVGYAVMFAFEDTFGGMNAPAKAVREKREDFITAVQKELGKNAPHPVCVALTEKIRAVLQPPAPAVTPDQVCRPESPPTLIP